MSKFGELLDEKIPILLAFFRSQESESQDMNPVLKDVAAALGDKGKVIKIDVDKNQFIEVDEFHQTLECMGFMITEEQVFELMRQMDENFDGRISYNELKAHILRLGFSLDKTLESRVPAGAQ